jgi:hypothetical protein
MGVHGHIKRLPDQSFVLGGKRLIADSEQFPVLPGDLLVFFFYDCLCGHTLKLPQIRRRYNKNRALAKMSEDRKNVREGFLFACSGYWPGQGF